MVAFIVLASASISAVADQGPKMLKTLDDDARKRVYVLARDGVVLLDAKTRRTVAHVTLPGWVWVGEKYSCPPDIALAPDGDVLVSSNIVPIIWRIEHRTLATTLHELTLEQDRDRDVGFTRLRWSRHLRTFVGMADSGARWHIDLSLSRARKAAGAPAGHSAGPCEG
jgi:hypothetical protein